LKKPNPKFRKHILIPLYIALLVLLSASIVNTYRLHRLHIDSRVKAHLGEVQKITLAHLSENSQVLSSVIDLNSHTYLKKSISFFLLDLSQGKDFGNVIDFFKFRKEIAVCRQYSL
jgi:hypothetical protein